MVWPQFFMLLRRLFHREAEVPIETQDLVPSAQNFGRLITKCSGRARVHQLGLYSLPHQHTRRNIIKDVFNVLSSASWPAVLSFYVISYALSYLFFAILWYSVSQADERCLLNPDDDSTFRSYSFNEAFLYSIETQASIGYGSKAVAGDCEVRHFSILWLCWLCLGLQQLAETLIMPRVLDRVEPFCCTFRVSLACFWTLASLALYSPNSHARSSADIPCNSAQMAASVRNTQKNYVVPQ